MATYVLSHGAGSDSWYWHRVRPLLEQRGHEVVTMDLPCADVSAGLAVYTRVVLDAIGDRTDLVVIGQSLGGFVAPLVCEQRPAQLLVLLNAMIPRPGETDWWGATAHPVAVGPDFDAVAVFLHDVSAEVVAESVAHVRPQVTTPMAEPHPLTRWPDVPTCAIVSRDDRFFPAAWQRGIVRDRLGIDPVEIDGGHCVALSRPRELVETLEALRSRFTRPEPARG